MKKTLELIRQEEIVKITHDLIELRSVNPPGNEKECAEYIAQILGDIGLQVEFFEHEKDRPNVVCRLKGSDGFPRLLYNGHMDVVPPGEGWSVEPFSGRVINGKIYGRGASDMKSGLAAMIVSAKALTEAGVRLRGDLILTAVIDEEPMGLGGTAHLIDKGLNADMAVIGEPTFYLDPSKGWRVEIAHRGHLWIEVTTEGKAAHGGRPWLGTNAVYMMTDVISAIRGLEKELSRKKHPLVSSPSINIGTIDGGTSINIVPDRCVITIDRRTIPTETSEEAKSEIVNILKMLHTRNQAFRSSWRVVNDTPPFEISPTEPIVASLRKAIRQVTGRDPVTGGKDATTEAHYFVNAGIPTALFGPGTVEKSHTVDEYAEIEKIVQASQVYALTALDILGEN